MSLGVLFDQGVSHADGVEVLHRVVVFYNNLVQASTAGIQAPSSGIPAVRPCRASVTDHVFHPSWKLVVRADVPPPAATGHSRGASRSVQRPHHEVTLPEPRRQRCILVTALLRGRWKRRCPCVWLWFARGVTQFVPETVMRRLSGWCPDPRIEGDRPMALAGRSSGGSSLVCLLPQTPGGLW
jgi:hypothetical protein